MRNGFSHADSSKILSDLPDETKMFQGSLTNPNEDLKEVSVNQKNNTNFSSTTNGEFC